MTTFCTNKKEALKRQCCIMATTDNFKEDLFCLDTAMGMPKQCPFRKVVK